MPRFPSEYAIYQGDTFLDIGTIAELAEKFEVAPETVRFWGTTSYLKRSKKENGEFGDCKIVIKLEDDDE